MGLDLHILVSNQLFIVKQKAQSSFKRHSDALIGRVLDVGCGQRPFQKFLKSTQYVGMEYSLARRPDLGGSALAIPFAAGTFDSVICTEVLEHLAQPELAIQEMHRVMRIGGAAYVTVPMSWCLHYEPHDYFRFTCYGLKHLLEKNGFSIVSVERLGGVFSLIGARLADVFFVFFYRSLFLLRLHEVRAKLALFLTIPISLTFYALGELFDGFDRRDAITWAVLCRKEGCS